MTEVDSAVILKTPYHLFLLRNFILKMDKIGKILAIAHPDLQEQCNKYFRHESDLVFEVIPKGDLYVKKLLKKPFRELGRVKRVVKENLKFVTQLLTSYTTPKKIFIFNDKDIFAQLYIYQVKKLSPSHVVAIEEGTSFYIEEKGIDRLLKLIYKILSPLILGFPYYYVSAYGSSKHVNDIYVRFPNRLPAVLAKSSKNIKPLELSNVDIVINSNSKKILLLSSPLAEYLVMQNGLETKIAHDLITFGTKKGYRVHLKPHPKEDVGKFSAIIETEQIELIEQDSPLEELDLASYSIIVNFASSAILDLINRNFPSENIITISPYSKRLSLGSVFESTRYISAYYNSKLTDYEVIRSFLFESLSKIMQKL